MPFLLWLALHWVLGPLDRAAKNRRYPIQFSLADFLCLFVQVQLALAGPALLFRGMEDKTPAVGASVAIVALVLLVWWTGVRTLSRAGVHGTVSRAFTLTIAIPFGFAAAFAIPILPVAIGEVLMDSASGMPWAALMGAVEIVLVALELALGFVTRRILATANRPREMPPPA